MFERILVGFDGSAPSRRAVQVATEMAGRFGSTLTIAMVLPPTRGVAYDRLETLVPLTDDGRTLAALLDELREHAVARGVQMVEPVTLRGEVLESLIGYLVRNPQDLVVVGSRGLTRGRRLLLGSVSTGLVNSAHCPVLVVRPGPPHVAPHVVKTPAHGEGHPAKSATGGPG